MSHYPPQPTFGVPFNPTGNLGSPPTAPYSNVANLPYYQPSDSSHPARAHPPAPYGNAHPFNAASQTVNMPLSRPGIAQIPYSGFSQPTSDSFAPPPYPSIQPLPYGSFPTPHPPPPSFFQRETQPAPIQAHVSLPSKPPPTTSSTAKGMTKDTPISTATITELEDGELSDGEGGRGARRPQDPGTSNEPRPPDYEQQVKFQRPNNQGTKTNNRGQVFSHLTWEEGTQHDFFKPKYSSSITNEREPGDYDHSSTSAKYLDPLNKDTSYPRETISGNEPQNPILQDPAKSTQSKEDVGTEPSEFAQPLYMGIVNPLATPVSAQLKGTGPETVNGSGKLLEISSPQYSHGSRGDLRQRAKDVLKELYPLKIRFSEFAKEGIEPRLLTELYAEIGIETPLSLPEYTTANGRKSSAQSKDRRALDHIEPLPESNTASQITSSHQKLDDTPKTFLHEAQVPESPRTAHRAILEGPSNDTAQNPAFSKKLSSVIQTQPQGDSQPQTSNTILTQTSTANAKPTSLAKLAKAPAGTLLGKSVIAKSGEKALERKDYIARMLAAKAGKPIPASNIPQATETTTNKSQDIPSKAESPKPLQNVDPGEEQRLLIENLSYRATESDVKGLFSAFPM